MDNREIPSVPITTLAGVASLTDLLPEMPLPTPLPQTLSNKSLLFHPRVAEEAQNLLATREHALIPQLVHSLLQTTTDHIELKDHYASTEPHVDQQQSKPQLLQAILEKNPNVFCGPANLNKPNVWNHATNSAEHYLLSSSASNTSYGQMSPCGGSRHTPQGSPASPASARLPLSGSHIRASVITEQQRTASTPPRPIPYGSTADPNISHCIDPSTPSNLAHQIVHQQPSVSARTPSQNCNSDQYQQVLNESLKHPQQTVRYNNSDNEHLQSTDTSALGYGSNVMHFTNNIQPDFDSLSLQRLQQNLVNVSPSGTTTYAPPETNSHNLSVPLNVSMGSADQAAKSMHGLLHQQAGVGEQQQQQQRPSNVCFAQTGAIADTNNHHVNHNNQFSAYMMMEAANSNQMRGGGLSCERQDHMAKPTNLRGPSPAQASDAPLAPTAPGFPSYSDGGEQRPPPPVMPQPVVRLNRIPQDQVLMQRSISAFAENRPELATQLGIISNNQDDEQDDDDSDDNYEPKTRSTRDRKRATQNKDDISDSFSPTAGSRKRSKVPTSPDNEMEVPKPKLRKVERRFVPVLEKLSVDELMETNTYVRFTRSIDKLLEEVDESALRIKRDPDDDAMAEDTLISRYQLTDLCSEAAKLKTLGAMHMIPADRLVRVLNILEVSIQAGERISPITDPDEREEMRQIWMETAMERVMGAVDASLTCMYIMTSSNMSKRVYLEDVIDRVILFIKYQLHNTIFPSFDAVYRIDNKKKVDNRKKKNQSVQVREKGIVQLYNKTHELVSLLAELLNLQTLTDTTVLHASSMGVCPFFVDNVSELQLSCLKLVTTIFTRYENHRRLLLDDILASIARLPSSKRGLRSYRLLSDTEEYIQMLTALVLQLIQCVVALPDNWEKDNNSDKEKDKDKEKEKEKETSTKTLDKDLFINNKFEIAKSTACTFLSVFLSKCGNKSEEIDYRPLFENFVQDLLTTVNKPEWPAAEMLLSYLGTILVKNFSNKSLDVTLRVASLDYLGVIAARLRKDAVTSRCKLQTIDQMIKDIKAEENKEGDTDSKERYIKKFNNPEDERAHFLQRVLLDYLAVNGQKDQAHRFARHFYLVSWYRDATIEKKTIASGKLPNKQGKTTNSKRRKSRDQTSDDDDEEDDISDPDSERVQAHNSNNQLNEMYRNIEDRKKFYISKIRPFRDNLAGGNRVQVLQTYIDYRSAELISQYLASKQQFSQSFDSYLKQILMVLRETSIAIRTKAMKCLTMIVEADPSVLGRKDMQFGVNHSLLDHSTSVREAAVDLVGKFVLSRPELIDKYYNSLLARILDTGVSVRKRVIKILKDICIECPQFHKIPEICVKMIRRVNDEEGIRKLVMEVFQNMWFTPTYERATCDSGQDLLLRKVMNIIDVVASSKDIGTEWFETLLLSLFKPREDKDDSTKIVSEPPKSLLTACRQIVDCLIENILRLEETAVGPGSGNERLVACLITLYLFAKIRPQLLVKHASTLQPYLSYKCQTRTDHQIVSYVAQTLELVVPLIVHPSETFLAQLEEDAIKLILQSERPVVASCIACLGSIVNNVTRNYKLIRDCFDKYYNNLCLYKVPLGRHTSTPEVDRIKPLFRRSMFTVGLLLRHFDFTDKDVIENLPHDIKDQVFNLLTFYLNLEDRNIQQNTLTAIGSICVRHYDFMLVENLKVFYHKMLADPNAPLEMKIEVLKNIEMYLKEEENRMIKQDQEWTKRSKEENLKEMGDISSGMASTVIQLYLKEILQSFIHPNIQVRHAAMRVINLILQQGLVHPVQIVPYLVCMSTDTEAIVSVCADKQLQDIEKKYPGFIHMKSQFGIRLSYQLQKILQETDIVRGFRIKEKGEYPSALNGFLYSILRNTKQQRRAIVLSILKQFDEQGRTSLSYMLYLADNLAYFPFQVVDEPLFIIHHIDTIISVSGTNLLQAFKEGLTPVSGENKTTSMVSNVSAEDSQFNNSVNSISSPLPNDSMVSLSHNIPTENSTALLNNTNASSILDDDDEEDENDLLARLPENTTTLNNCITAAQGCLLLLVVKQHLKDIYGISDSKILQYSPTEVAKVYEKAVSRRSNTTFNPKATLNKLRQGSPLSVLDEDGRKDLISQYLDFKQLMLKLDPDDDDDDESPNGQRRVISSANNSLGVKEDQNQTDNGDAATSLSSVPSVISNDVSTTFIPPSTGPSNITKDTPPRVPKLVISNRRSMMTPDGGTDSKKSRSYRVQSDKQAKKHRPKKKRKKISVSSGEDSENDFSDPDFSL